MTLNFDHLTIVLVCCCNCILYNFQNELLGLEIHIRMGINHNKNYMLRSQKRRLCTF